AGAAIDVTGGTLHVAADYRSVDKPFVPPETDALLWIDQSTRMPTGPSFNAHDSVSFVDGQIGISTEIGWTSSGYDVVASGSLYITEDQPETVRVRINPVPHGYQDIYQGGIWLDAAGGNVFISSVDPLVDPYSDFVVSLSPGQYTLNWYTGEEYPLW